VGETSEEFRVVAALIEEFKEVLEFPWAFALEEPLSVACRFGLPF
jgi:hypothetical protein